MSDKTILVGEFKHETNTFSPTVTDRAAFQNRWELFGDAIPAEFKGTNSPIGGFVDRAEDYKFDLRFGVAANAMPGGRVTAEAYEFYTDMLVETAEAAKDELDAVFLSLHGAMAPEGRSDGEGPLLRAIRDVVGDVPLAITVDPHANLTDETARLADGLFAYETYPHIDHADRGHDAADFLAEYLAGNMVNPVIELERPPLLPDFPQMNTRKGPMCDVAARARQLESQNGVHKVNLLFGFNHADTPDTGMCLAVVGDDSSAASDTARELAEMIWNRRTEFVADYPTTDQAIAHAAETLDSGGRTEDGPLILVDIGDNPGGGGVEDRTELLRALLESDLQVDEGGLALVWDPDSVGDCVDAGVGKQVSLSLGHHVDDPYFQGEPLVVEGYVKSLTDGEFTNHGPKETGVRQHLGRTARVDCEDLDVLVTERRYSPNDAEIWRHMGLPPERCDLLILKSVNHFRADYEPLADDIVLVDTPGSFAIDLTRFDYQQLRGLRYPLDDDVDYLGT